MHAKHLANRRYRVFRSEQVTLTSSTVHCHIDSSIRFCTFYSSSSRYTQQTSRAELAASVTYKILVMYASSLNNPSSRFSVVKSSPALTANNTCARFRLIFLFFTIYPLCMCMLTLLQMLCPEIPPNGHPGVQ